MPADNGDGAARSQEARRSEARALPFMKAV